MPDIPEYTVISDGTPEGTRVFANGDELKGIKALTIFAQAQDMVELVVEVNVTMLEYIGKEAKFVGLEDVPIEALQQELERRDE